MSQAHQLCHRSFWQVPVLHWLRTALPGLPWSILPQETAFLLPLSCLRIEAINGEDLVEPESMVPACPACQEIRSFYRFTNHPVEILPNQAVYCLCLIIRSHYLVFLLFLLIPDIFDWWIGSCSLSKSLMIWKPKLSTKYAMLFLPCRIRITSDTLSECPR